MNKSAAAAIAAIAAIAASGFASAVMAQGPKASPGNSIPAVEPGTPFSQYDAAMQGPKVSSGTRIVSTHFTPAAAAQPATTAQRYVRQEGYEAHGKWRGRWVLTQ